MSRQRRPRPVDMRVYFERLAGAAIGGTAIFCALPATDWAWLPALVGLYGWLGLVLLFAYWANGGNR